MSKLKSYSGSAFREYSFYFILLIISMALAYATGVYGIQAGGIILGAFMAIAGVLAIFYSYRVGLYFILFYVFFIFVISGWLPVRVQVGILVDALCVLTLLSMWIHFFNTDRPDKQYPFRNAIGYMIIVLACLDAIQLLNPAVKDFAFGVVTFRETLYLLAVYFISFQALNTKRAIANFSFIWVVLCLIVAVYAIKQEHFGLTDGEWNYLRSDARRYELYVVWGHVRKWSFLSDPSIFGMTMAFCAVFCFVITLQKINWKIRLASFICFAICSVSMSYSGTRTAVGVVPIGIAFYFLMTLNNPKMMAAAVATVLLFLVLFFGPFYGPTLNRMRSAFSPSEDPSMSFRDMKRHILQDYVWHHPIGAGLGSANEIAGRLSITADTDSGFLRTAIDKGLLGLLIQFTLYFIVMLFGINAFYDSDDPLVKSLLAAYLSAFLALTVANFYQDAVDQKPMNILVDSVFAIILRLYLFVKNKKISTDKLNLNPI